MTMNVKVQETRTVPEEDKRKTGEHHERAGDILGSKLYDHQPSSSTVGAVDTTLAVGDDGRMLTPLRFDVSDPFPFDIRSFAR